ncbi:unnamed protein product [Larinioides sclopetarius]|uniref:Uncharacterized protein n=1 Tax=Larinioides sclopetarius TaxID=280406 RepID=A0AAV2B6D5_9ARAC
MSDKALRYIQCTAGETVKEIYSFICDEKNPYIVLDCNLLRKEWNTLQIVELFLRILKSSVKNLGKCADRLVFYFVDVCLL